MSAQSTKKKRIGSRRWVANQSKTSEADEFHVTDSTSVMQRSTPGENTESLNILANPDYSKSETQNPPSPELSKHRKKLGSSRRNKREQHGKDSAAESYDKSREEVEEKTRGDETPRKTQMYVTIQAQQQEELSQKTEDDMSARHDSSVYSAITPDYFSEVQYSTGSNNPETDQESLISKSQNPQANQDEHDADFKVVSDSCTLVETMLEGTHKSDTVQLTENAHLVGISEVTSLNLPSGPTVDQQLIDQSSSTEIGGDERYNVDSLTEKESKEQHEGTYLLGQDGNLQGNDLESDSHVKSVVTEFSTTPEITTDQISPRTNTELECTVEQAMFSSPNEHLNLHQVNSAQHSEDAVNKECEQEFKPTEMYEINHSSSVTHVTEDAEVTSGNVVDQAEICDTYQSELIVKSTDDSATRQLDSNPDDKHDVHPTKENNFDTLKQTHEDDLYDTEIPQINLMSESHLRSDDIEFSTESEITTDDSRTREHAEPECSIEQAMLSSPKDGLPKTEVEGVHHLEDAVNKVHEQEVMPTQKHEMDRYSDHDEHDKRETDFKAEVSDKSVGAPLEEMDKSDTLQSESSLQTQQSETNAPLDSQPQQNDTDFNSIGNKRKLGSTRRNKGRHRVKESVAESYISPTEEVVESVSDSEALETTQMLVATEKTNQEESSPESCDVAVPATDDNSLYSAIMSDYSSELQSSNTTNYPETDMESLIPKSENLQEDHDEEVKATHELDHSSESVTQVATEDAEIFSGNLIDQAEISDTYQFEFIVKGTDDSAAKQEDVNTDDKQDVHPTKENSIEASEQTNEDYHVYDTEKLQISDTERVVSAFGHVYEDESKVVEDDIKPSVEQAVHQEKEGILSGDEEGESSLQTQQSETNAPLDSQPQQNDTDCNSEKLQISDTERVDSALGHVYEGEASVVEDDIKPSVEQTVHQEKEGLNSEVEESVSSSQTLQSGTNAYLDSQPQQNDTDFNPVGSRRKLGSSRRNRGRRHAKDPVAESNDSPAEEIVGNIRDNAQTEGISDQVKENEHVGALAGISEFMFSSVHPNLTVDQQVIDLSNSTEMPEQDLSNVYSVKEKESKDGDEGSDLLRQDGNSQGNYLVSESHLKLSNIESSTTPEISTEKSSTGEHADTECVKQAAVSSPEEEFSTNEEQKNVNFSQDRGSLHSEDVLNEVHEEVVKPTQMQEMHQIDFSSINESLQSKMNALLNSQDNSQDNSVSMEEETDFNPTGNRRKLGSSRKNKGRQQVKVSIAKTYHEPKDEFVENARGDEALETTKMLLATDTTGQEEFRQQTNLDLKPVNNKENTEKMPEDTILSQNVMDNSTTTDIASSSGKDDSVKQHENFSQFTGNNTVKTDLMQSPEDDSYIQNISNHDDSVTTRPVTTDVLEQEDAYLVQSREGLSCDKDSWQQIDDAIETMGYVIKDYNTEVASSVDVQVFRQDEVGEIFEDPTKKDHEAQEMNISQGITHAELFSAAQTNIGTSAPFDIGLKENRAGTAVDVPKESGISCNQQQGIQEKTDSDNSENLQGKSKEKRRKMGSTRRTQLNRKPEEGMGNEDENKESDSNMVDMKFDSMEVVELPVIVTADVHQNGNTKLSPVDIEQQGTNVISTVQDLAFMVLPPVDPTKENNFEALEQTNEEEQISGIERVDTALGQVYVIEGQVEDDIKPSAEQTVLQEKEGIFSEVEESNSSLQTLQSGTNATLDSQPEQNDTNFKPIGSRRKLGSSRRNKGRQHAKDSEQQGTNEISTVQDLALMALPPEQSTVDVEPSQLDDFTSTEMHVPSVLARTNTTNTGITGENFVSSYETTQSAQNDEERLESVNLRQDQALKSAEATVVADLEMMKSIVRGGAEDEHKDDQANIQELNDVNEGAHNTNLEMKNSSPNLNSPARRRKMGSTRRNMGSRSIREDLHQQQEVENEATETVTNVGDVKSASFQSIEEKEELQPLTEDKEIDSEQRKEKVFETVEYSHAFESHVKPPPHQEIEENPVSHVQLVETDYHLTPRDLPAIPSTSPTAGGRRRKLGSSRKSRGHQTEREDRITDTQNRRDVKSITEESDIKTTEEDSLGLDKISEVDESDKKPPSNISASKAEEHSRPVSEKTPQQVTPVHTTFAEIGLRQESQKTFSLAGSPKGAALKSDSYNVMMVGDSSVGKSSFMKRAQSGKFSLDLPASVGLDSCTWTVVVDGKPVVLQLWDTAGQERFHSITRQIFHKAQAFLLMYDITSTQSFSAVSYWANCIREGAAENVTILLLGNKNDKAERKVKTEEGANLARECNFEFMECSAATGENVIHSLETVARMLSQKVDTREETTVLQKQPQQKKSGCC